MRIMIRTSPRDYAGFLKAILEEAHDDSLKLIFADWLEEQGDPAVADILRSPTHFWTRGIFSKFLCAWSSKDSTADFCEFRLLGVPKFPRCQGYITGRCRAFKIRPGDQVLEGKWICNSCLTIKTYYHERPNCHRLRCSAACVYVDSMRCFCVCSENEIRRCAVCMGHGSVVIIKEGW